MEGGFCFCGGWNFSKSVSVGSTFIREMRVCAFFHVSRFFSWGLFSKLPHCLQNISVAQPSLGWSGSMARLVALHQAGQYVLTGCSRQTQK